MTIREWWQVTAFPIVMLGSAVWQYFLWPAAMKEPSARTSGEWALVMASFGLIVAGYTWASIAIVRSRPSGG